MAGRRAGAGGRGPMVRFVVGVGALCALLGSVVALPSALSATNAQAATATTCNPAAPIEAGGVNAHLTGPLVVVGNQLCDAGAKDAQVVLKGIVEDSLAQIPLGFTAVVHPPTSTEITAMHQKWGANFVRLQLSAEFVDRAFGKPECPNQTYDPAYLNDIDTVVNSATANGMFVLLDPVTTNPNCAFNDGITLESGGMPLAMPGPDVREALTLLGGRYGTQRLVGFELYNEPHVCQTLLGPESEGIGSGPNILCDPEAQNASLWANGAEVNDGTTYYGAGMNQLYATVRGAAPNSPVFIDANQWSEDANSFASKALNRASMKNVVAALHYYPCTVAPCAASMLAPSYAEGVLKGHLTANAVIKSMAVVVDEFGVPQAYRDDPAGAPEMSNVVCFLNRTGLASEGNVGWAAFAWAGNSDATAGPTDPWSLLTAINGILYLPNDDGAPVEAALQGNYSGCSPQLGY